VEGDVFIGGGKVIDSFRRADLIDEWRIYTHPIILGGGRPLLSPGESMAQLTLLGTRTFGNGVVLTRYSTRGDAA